MASEGSIRCDEVSFDVRLTEGAGRKRRRVEGVEAATVVQSTFVPLCLRCLGGTLPLLLLIRTKVMLQPEQISIAFEDGGIQTNISLQVSPAWPGFRGIRSGLWTLAVWNFVEDGGPATWVHAARWHISPSLQHPLRREWELSTFRWAHEDRDLANRA